MGRLSNAKKQEFAAAAKIHIAQMEEDWAAAISHSVSKTKLYPNVYGFSVGPKKSIEISLENVDTVSAAFSHINGTDKVALLNFASYKNPGGRFLDGSMAQEENLCAASTLYNVLSRFQHYYDYNSKRLNYGLYRDRALYSPDIVFFKDNNDFKCDVITCAAPNLGPALRYKWTDALNRNHDVLRSRLEFVLRAAADNNVDTLILGAFGCGVFKQDATEVCNLFLDLLDVYPYFNKVIFAIPGNDENGNYNKFKKVFQERKLE